MDKVEAKNASEVTVWSRTADVLVIGQGIAGACAALEARRAGADVLVIERAGGGGGASSLSGGTFYLGGGTAVQKACGYEDSAEEMFRFLVSSCNPLDHDAVRLFCDESVEHFDWLEAQGVPFDRTVYSGKTVIRDDACLMSSGSEKVWPYRTAAKPSLRGHKVNGPMDGSGANAMNPLIARCEEAGVDALYNAEVTALVVDDAGRVVGVSVKQFGEQSFIAARRAVVIAAGGFGMNRAMVREFIPLLDESAEALGTPHNDGSSVRLGLSVGAALAAMDGVMPTAAIYEPEVLVKGIIVNNQGQRFVAEDSYHGRTAVFTMEQPAQTAYLIVDSETFAYPIMSPHALVDGWETIAEMEAGLGLPEGSLQRTLANYNRDAAAGEDRLFYKHPDYLQPLDKGPWAAFDISCHKSVYHFITLGGLRTSTRGEVLDPEGRAIRGLYAAGAAAAHLPTTGKGYASGLSLAPGSFFGRRAGRHAAAEAPANAAALA